MKGIVKLSTQAVLLLAVIYVLASIFGAAFGMRIQSKDFGLRVGPKQHRGRRPGSLSNPAAPWAQTGMGAELIASPGTSVPMVGIQSMNP